MRQELVAGDVGQVEVEQDEARRVGAGQIDGGPALHRGLQRHTGATGDDALQELDVGDVVLDVEDLASRRPRARWRSRGSRGSSRGPPAPRRRPRPR